MGMEQAGHKCVGYVEIDKYARKSYEAIYDTEGEWTAHDITTVTDNDIRFFRGKVDVICGGFPCQAFSVAGKRGGFQDTRGTLFFDIARLAKQIQPRLLLLENVKGLLSHDTGKTFGTIIKSLDELGYDAEWQVLNSKNFGVPQNRERVFIVGHLRGESGREIFPIEGENGNNLIEVGHLDIKSMRSTKAVYHPDGVSPTVTTMGGGHREPKILDTKPKDAFRVYECYSPTLQANDHKEPKNVINDKIVRKLTPRECWRLQGFPDWAFDKAQEVNSNSQLYKQAGNSVTVNVIYEIARRLGDDIQSI